MKDLTMDKEKHNKRKKKPKFHNLLSSMLFAGLVYPSTYLYTQHATDLVLRA